MNITEFDERLIGVLCAVSVALFFLPFLLALVHELIVLARKERRGASRLGGRLLWGLLMLIGSVWTLRFAVGYYESLAPNAALTWIEELFNTFVHTLQTFSMDEDYTKYIDTGKQMVRDVFGARGSLAAAYGIYASVLNVIAPIAGGAAIFEIIASIFPKARLLLANMAFWNEKYYFSELNDRALALAKSILSAKKRFFAHPTVIFTDAYSDSEDERRTERLQEAKAIGAICVREDLVHIPKRRLGKRRFFLIDEEGKEIDNLQTLTKITSDFNCRYLRKSKIYLFVRGDAYTQVEEQVRERLEAELKPLSRAELQRGRWRQRLSELLYARERKTRRGVTQGIIRRRLGIDPRELTELQFRNLLYEKYTATAKLKARRRLIGLACRMLSPMLFRLTRPAASSRLPVITPVEGYRNIVSNLLTRLPLYEPLVHKPRDPDGTTDLRITILGTGIIGTEMFLSSYWCGQLLDCRLHINVVSLESRESFFGRVDHVNPDIRRTAEPGNSILRINHRGDMAEPYCRIGYLEADVKASSLDELLSVPAEGGNAPLWDSDYFVVALGSDEENLSVASRLRGCVGRRHLSLRERREAVIAYVVYNSALCRALNHDRSVDHSLSDGSDIYMQAFGSLEEVYSAQNIFMSEHGTLVEQVNAGYLLTVRQTAPESRLKDEYNYWSSLARGVHIRYKMFSAGVIHRSVFDLLRPWTKAEEKRGALSREEYEERRRAAEREYAEELHRAEKEYCARIMGEGQDVSLSHRLAWLEHRRWNAFMRSKGFRYTPEYLRYYEKIRTHKYLALKLHPCIVECDARGVRGAVLRRDGSYDEKTTFRCADPAEWDLLDEVSYRLRSVNEWQYDFKIYDYPAQDFLFLEPWERGGEKRNAAGVKGGEAHV